MFPIAQRLRTKDGPELMTDALVFAFFWAVFTEVGRGIVTFSFGIWDAESISAAPIVLALVGLILSIAARLALVAGAISLLG
ncbi:hypothetical protein MNBD_PLANCTO03-1086, partial [hydrothermal vent metagenome]